MKRRDLELTILFKRLYEDSVLGRIPDEHFRMLSSEYTDEQKILRINISKAEEKMEKLKNSLTNVELFIEKAKRYTDITELTAELLHLFIAKIVVGKRLKDTQEQPNNASGFTIAILEYWMMSPRKMIFQNLIMYSLPMDLES